MESSRTRLRNALLPLAALAHVAACSDTSSDAGADANGSTSNATSSGSTTGNGASSSGSTPDGAAPIGPIVPPGDPGPADVTFEIAADRDARPISPLIYGINGSDDVANNRWGLLRSGGNRLTAYNWETNASNAGSDYQFQNDGHLSASDAPGQVFFDIVDAAAMAAAGTVITIPNVDYVAADKNGDGDVRNSGASYLSTRFKRNHPAKGSAFAATPDVSDDAVYQDELVAFLKAQRPSAQILFSMDNEPDLWSSTHAEIVSTAVTYADLWQRNHDYAKATKAVWPEAEILGFVSYGYNGYVTLQNAPDAAGRDFIDWYLDQASAAEASDGMRVIDYLDLHWYPEAQGGGQRVVGGGNADAVVAAREQAPRSLWDATYEETSWIRDFVAGPIDLLHWLQAKIDAHYPGTKLAFSEWNFGGGDHISGSIAVADVLGIFGRYGIGLAAYWPISEDESFAHAAFRAFRNYDGSGGSFGDTSIAASTSDASVSSVYASIDGSDPTRTVIIAINKGATVMSAGLKISQSVSYASAAVFVLSGTHAQLVSASALTPVATNAFKYDMPAQSVSVIVPQP